MHSLHIIMMDALQLLSVTGRRSVNSAYPGMINTGARQKGTPGRQDISLCRTIVEGVEGDVQSCGCVEPNAGNGYDAERYTWTQTLADATVSVPVPLGTKGRACEVTITRATLKVNALRMRPTSVLSCTQRTGLQGLRASSQQA